MVCGSLSAVGAAEVSPGRQAWVSGPKNIQAPEVRHISHTYSQNVVHVVFGTKDRRRAISPEFQPRLWAYAAGICQKLGILVHAVGGAEDHIHLVMQVPPSVALAKAILTLKSNSSQWANERAKIRVAGRLWRDQCEQFQGSRGRPIHTKSRGGSQEDGFQCGVSRLVEKAGIGFCFEICVWLGVAPTALGDFPRLDTPCLRTGLTSCAPPALGEDWIFSDS